MEEEINIKIKKIFNGWIFKINAFGFSLRCQIPEQYVENFEASMVIIQNILERISNEIKDLREEKNE